MKIKRSRLQKIIQEEIEKDIQRSIVRESTDAEKEEWKELLRLNRDHPDVPDDFKRTYLGILDAAQSMQSDLTRFERQPTDPNTYDPQEAAEIIYAVQVEMRMEVFLNMLNSTTLSQGSKDVIAAGGAIVIPNRAIFQVPDPDFWPKGKKLPASELSGCEAVAKSVIAGTIYKAVYKTYEKTVGKADAFLKAYLGRLVGTRKLNIIAAFLTPETVKRILSLALVIRLLRDNDDVKAAVTNLQDEFCGIRDFHSAYQAIENVIISTGGAAPEYARAAIEELEKKIKKSKEEMDETPGGTSGTGEEDADKPDQAEDAF